MPVALPCTLRRPKGSPIAAQTLDLGAGGMLVRSGRPLVVDEEVDFDLAELAVPVSAHARVVRQQLHDVYALRFEGLGAEAQRCLRALATAGAGPRATAPQPTRIRRHAPPPAVATIVSGAFLLPLAFLVLGALREPGRAAADRPRGARAAAHASRASSARSRSSTSAASSSTRASWRCSRCR